MSDTSASWIDGTKLYRAKTHGVLGLWPRAEDWERALELLTIWFRSVTADTLTRNIEYTPATHTPSLRFSS